MGNVALACAVAPRRVGHVSCRPEVKSDKKEAGVESVKRWSWPYGRIVLNIYFSLILANFDSDSCMKLRPCCRLRRVRKKAELWMDGQAYNTGAQ